MAKGSYIVKLEFGSHSELTYIKGNESKDAHFIRKREFLYMLERKIVVLYI